MAEKTLGIAAVAVRTTPDVPPLTSEDERKSMLEELVSATDHADRAACQATTLLGWVFHTPVSTVTDRRRSPPQGLLDEGDEQSSPEPYIHFDVQPPRSGGISSLRQTPPTGRLPQQSPPSYGGGATPASEGGVTPPRANGAPRAPGDKDLTPTKGQVLQMQNQMSEVKARLSEQELVVVKKEQMLRGLQAQLRASQDQVAQLEAQLQQVQASAALLAASAPARAAAAVPASLQVELEDARRAAAAAAEARDEAVAQAQQLREQMKKQQADFEDRMQSLIASAGKTRENDDARKSAATAAAATAAAAEVREATAARDAATAEVRQLKEELRKQQAEFEGRLAAAEARAGESRVAQGAAAALEGMTPALQKALGQVAALQLSKEALSSEVRALKAETFGGAAVSRLRQQVEQFVGKREAAVKAEVRRLKLQLAVAPFTWRLSPGGKRGIGLLEQSSMCVHMLPRTTKGVGGAGTRCPATLFLWHPCAPT